MRLILKPRGRGNWTPTTITIEGARLPWFDFRAGDDFALGGVVFRICEVIS